MDFNKIWKDIVNFFETNVWNIVLFVAVLLIGIIVIKLTLNILRRILNKTKLEKIAVGFFMIVLKFLFYLILVLILMSVVGININGLLTALSAIVLAIGLALQNIISNAANGLIIISNKMFKQGDYITVAGVEGSVIEINFLFTTLKTPDNKRVTLPNSTIVNSPVIDNDTFSTRRVEWKFEVSYESDVESVKKIIVDCMASNGLVRLDPAPTCRLYSLNSSGIQFVARCWVDREDYWTVYFDMLELCYNELKRNNISIPYNQLEIRERKDKVVLPVNGKGIPKRVEKKRVEKRDFDLENIDIPKLVAEEKKKKKERREKRKEEKLKEKVEKQKSNAKKDKKVEKKQEK